MTDTAYPLSHPTLKTTDFSKINTIGVGDNPHVTSAYQEMLDTNKQLSDALEKRFAQPNWLKVSAALAKPQLGGFGASFGSAMDELGKQEEASRAVAPTVAQMRAQVAESKFPLAQNVAQRDAFAKFQANPTEENARQVLQFGTETEMAKTVKQHFPTLSTIAGTRSTEVGTAIAGQKAVADNPFIVLNDPMFKGTVAEPKPDQVAGYVAKLDAAKPKDVDPAQWAGMSVSDKQDAVARYAKEQTAVGMDEEQKSAVAARTSDGLLNDLTYLRTLAVDPKLAPMFSLFKNGDAVGMLRAFLDKNPGNAQAAIEGLTAAAMENLKNTDDATRAKADKFIKGIARLEVNLRGSSINPTNAFQELNSQQSPSLGNSQSGFVGILDQMGLQAAHELDRHNLRVESKVPARRMLTSPEARELENKYRDEAETLARADALRVTPSWYKPQASAAAKESAAARAASTAPAAGGSMTERLQQELARRAQQQRP